ncbi:hypothetical protein PN465_15885 [Nodularia spumigena CS-584]|jgi:hypothetical protein|nr:hypothetical protein [Nodularia spumigena]MDB9355414.1 hypothetical protein [Nodularia spumigena CS-587/03]EAW47197.1 hypothetical protein N9414_05070 [Nodularia spumigena CCY9414]KZL49205.1 hypothetical protein A2T98_14015 [Nodularia spumigena CENA596]MDB9337757.1 hypothetical protein [Nodularia spumigena CS-589/07]MDB9345172.1 hypothetical protein [Nodularia spumigena CS-588/06]
MNAVLPRFIKSAYRKDTIISVLMTVGVVDALIGGLDDSWSLFAFGLGTAGISLAFKLWRIQQRRPLPDQPVVQHYLPSQSSSPTLPILTISKKKPPRSGRDI